MPSTLTPTSAAITPETTVGAIVAAQPALARFFEKLGIDYCCGGKQSLAEACARRELNVATTITLLDSAADVFATSHPEVDAAGMTLTELADHIEKTHHVYVKSELPRLIEMADRVATKHGHRDPRLIEMSTVVHALTDELFDHMQKEEVVLFPMVRRLEASEGKGTDSRVLIGPITQMEAEHDHAGQAIARLRELTDGFTPDAESCNTHRSLLSGLAQFESDLHRHVHKENNILFPRALALSQAE